jgi:hypothetical protein
VKAKAEAKAEEEQPGEVIGESEVEVKAKAEDEAEAKTKEEDLKSEGEVVWLRLWANLKKLLKKRNPEKPKTKIRKRKMKNQNRLMSRCCQKTYRSLHPGQKKTVNR